MPLRSRKMLLTFLSLAVASCFVRPTQGECILYPTNSPVVETIYCSGKDVTMFPYYLEETTKTVTRVFLMNTSVRCFVFDTRIYTSLQYVHEEGNPADFNCTCFEFILINLPHLSFRTDCYGGENVTATSSIEPTSGSVTENPTRGVSSTEHEGPIDLSSVTSVQEVTDYTHQDPQETSLGGSLGPSTSDAAEQQGSTPGPSGAKRFPLYAALGSAAVALAVVVAVGVLSCFAARAPRTRSLRPSFLEGLDGRFEEDSPSWSVNNPNYIEMEVRAEGEEEGEESVI